jgi:predicted Zn finger-like uncharacterized protein
MVEITCPHCNYSKSVALEDIPEGVKWVRCPQCRNRFKYQKREEDSKTEKRHATPWERRSQLGLWASIKRTLGSVMFSPKRAFSTMPVRGGLREPLAFGLLVGSISIMFGFFWDFLIAHSGFVKPWGGFPISLSSPLLFLFFIFLAPLLEAINILVTSLIIHLLLLLVGAGTNKFEATFRVVAYSQATRVWSIIPVIGSPIGWVWRSIVQIIGLKEAHDTSYGRIVVAFLIPLAMLIVVIAVGAFFLISRL